MDIRNSLYFFRSRRSDRSCVLTYQHGSCKHSGSAGGVIMKYRVYGLAAVGIGAFLAARPLVAHHEILAKFDDKKPMTLKGTVTKLDWANPHVHIFMNVASGNT